MCMYIMLFFISSKSIPRAMQSFGVVLPSRIYIGKNNENENPLTTSPRKSSLEIILLSSLRQKKFELQKVSYKSGRVDIPWRTFEKVYKNFNWKSQDQKHVIFGWFFLTGENGVSCDFNFVFLFFLYPWWKYNNQNCAVLWELI